MSPLDLSVMIFFITIAVKAVFDSFKFWKEQDELAAIEHDLAALNSKRTVNTPNKNAVRVTRTQYRVYRRADIRRPALSPDPLCKDLHFTKRAGRQMETAA